MKKTLLTTIIMIIAISCAGQTEFNLGIGMSKSRDKFTNIEVSAMGSFIFAQANWNVINENKILSLGTQFKVNEKFSYTPMIGRCFWNCQSNINYGIIFTYRFVDRFRIYTGISNLEGYKVGVSAVFGKGNNR